MSIELGGVMLAPFFPLALNMLMGLTVTLACIIRGNWSLGVFVYLTFFFAYSTIPLITNPEDSRYFWFQNNRPNGLSLAASLFFLTVIVAAITQLFRGGTRLSSISIWYPEGATIPLFALCIPLSCWRDLSGSEPHLSLATKGMVSALGMVAIAIALAILSNSQSKTLLIRQARILIGGTLVFCTCIAIWEVASQSAWVANTFRDNLAEFRASATFLNPNFFGAWIAAVALFYSYTLSVGTSRLDRLILAMSAVALFLSGSRSALILTMVCLTLPLAFSAILKISGEKSYVGLSIFIVSFLMTVAAAYALGSFFQDPSLTGFYALSVRFWALPADVLGYVFSHSSPDIDASISGRFTGANVDNGYIVSTQGGGRLVGIMSITAWVTFLASLTWRGLRRLASNPSLDGIYALTALAYCVLIGLVMQAYQAFPIWGFVSILLSYFFLWCWNAPKRPHT